ncbi:MAG: hypothetical protein AAGC71_09280 [Pseudomonadota bacterium]
MSEHAPIQNLGSLDLIGQRNDGGVDTVIVVSSLLQATPAHEALLRSKIQAYTDAIFSDGWQQQFGDGAVSIYIRAVVMPEQGIVDLIGAIKQHLHEFGITLYLEITESS